jgi:hypothetical protein
MSEFTHYFRIRTAEALLDRYRELETQTIYFASPEELNDPMEGFRDLVWHGDEIVWTNFFKHYLRCLGISFTFLVISKEDFDWSQIPVEDPAHANTPAADALDEEIFKVFFTEPSIRSFIVNLGIATHPIRRDELVAYFRLIHPFAALIVQDVYAANGLAPRPSVDPEVRHSIVKALCDLTTLLHSADAVADAKTHNHNARVTLFSITRHMSGQVHLIDEYNRHDTPIPGHTRNKDFVYFRFPNEYVDQLDRLAYPKWYAACFMSEIGNASLWGSYGAGHTGVALKFKAHKSARHPTMGLHGINGWSTRGSLKGIIQHEFLPVTYGRSHPEIDFFTCIGNMSVAKLNKDWYYDSQGRKSSKAEAIYSDQTAWRKLYWDNFSKIVSTKLEDWKHENEHRILFASSIVNHEDSKPDRLLKYDFDSLDGIVFGIKTSMEHKLAIMRIIEKKCREESRKSFNFYQAYFSSIDGTIGHAPMSLLKFSA